MILDYKLILSMTCDIGAIIFFVSDLVIFANFLWEVNEFVLNFWFKVVKSFL